MSTEQYRERKRRWREANPVTHAWAFWTAARASAEYVAGRIGEDEWHTRVGIARLAVGREVPDWPGPEDGNG